MEKFAGNGQIVDVALDLIVNNTDNPRGRVPAKTILGLAESIKAVGLLQPVILRPRDDGKYDICAGWRRVAACRALKMNEIPALVLDLSLLGDDVRAAIGIIENSQREQVNPVAEALAVGSLISEGSDVKAIAQTLGRSERWVARRARLTTIPKKVLNKLNEYQKENGFLKMEVLEELALLDNDTLEEKFDEELALLDLSIEYIRRDVERNLIRMSSMVFTLDEVVPDCPVCVDCVKRTSCQPTLFDQIGEEHEHMVEIDRCMDKGCWLRKTIKWWENTVTTYKEKYPNLMLMSKSYYRYKSDSDEYGTILGPLLRKIVCPYDVHPAKKGEAGQVPALSFALVLDDFPNRKIGSVRMVVPNDARRTEKRAKGEKATPEELAVSRLNRERAKKCRALIAHLQTCETPKVNTSQIATLMAVFGTISNRTYIDGGCSIGAENPWDGYQHLISHINEKDYGPFMDLAWHQVSPVLRKRLQYDTVGKVEKHYNEALLVSAVIGVDLDELVKKEVKAGGKAKRGRPVPEEDDDADAASKAPAEE